MTPEQRDAAIQRMEASFVADCKFNTDAKANLGVTITSRKMTANALDALLSGFVVIPKDDVTERHDYAVFAVNGEAVTTIPIVTVREWIRSRPGWVPPEDDMHDLTALLDEFERTTNHNEGTREASP